MSQENIKLIKPTAELKAEFLAMVEDFKTEDKEIIDGIGSIDKDSFDDSVRRAKDHACGIGLPEGWVPASTYWVVCKNRIIGTCELRHRLTEALKKYGGHIGYSIRPSQRGKGYGTKMLALALEKAKGLGLKRVLITCGDDNIASASVIENNRGKLADKIQTEQRAELTRRYWIEL